MFEWGPEYNPGGQEVKAKMREIELGEVEEIL